MELRRIRLTMLVAIIGMILASCGGGDGSSPAPTEAGESDVSQDADDPPAEPEEDTGGEDGAPAPAGPGGGSYTVNGEPFTADMFRCEPFSFGSQEAHPDDLSLLAYGGGMEGLELEISYDDNAPVMGAAGTFERVDFDVFYSRSGEEGTEQFEGNAEIDPEIGWYVFGEGAEKIALDGPPFVIDGNRVTGSFSGLKQTWPEGGSDTVDVTFDFEIPSSISDQC